MIVGVSELLDSAKSFVQIIPKGAEQSNLEEYLKRYQRLVRAIEFIEPDFDHDSESGRSGTIKLIKS